MSFEDPTKGPEQGPRLNERFLTASRRLLGDYNEYSGTLPDGRDFVIERKERGKGQELIVSVDLGGADDAFKIANYIISDKGVRKVIELEDSREELLPNASTREEMLAALKHKRLAAEANEEMQLMADDSKVSGEEFEKLTRALEQVRKGK